MYVCITLGKKYISFHFISNIGFEVAKALLKVLFASHPVSRLSGNITSQVI